MPFSKLSDQQSSVFFFKLTGSVLLPRLVGAWLQHATDLLVHNHNLNVNMYVQHVIQHLWYMKFVAFVIILFGKLFIFIK
jgi:hypothetical protein